jgi:hypothetical protein
VETSRQWNGAIPAGTGPVVADSCAGFGRYLSYRGGGANMIQTGPALALIATTLVCIVLLYFATIKYVSEVLVDDEHEDHGDGDHAA